LGERYAPKTVRNSQGTLHKALGDAVRQGVLSRNPAIHAELPRAERSQRETWTADELALFLARALTHRLYAAWHLMCSTGMRRSEVLGARWQNLDLEAGRLAVVDTVVPVRNRPVLRLGETKSRGSRRVIALDIKTVAVLREHRKRQNEERLRAGEAWEDLDLVFTNEIGGMVNPDWFTRTTKTLAGDAGVPALTPHDAARHTWATLAPRPQFHSDHPRPVFARHRGDGPRRGRDCGSLDPMTLSEGITISSFLVLAGFTYWFQHSRLIVLQHPSLARRGPPAFSFLSHTGWSNSSPCQSSGGDGVSPRATLARAPCKSLRAMWGAALLWAFRVGLKLGGALLAPWEWATLWTRQWEKARAD
jgi:hypothetical protein